MFFYIYKITHIESGKYYYGRRASTISPDGDPYMGSGKLLKAAIDKHGVESFRKEVISLHRTIGELIHAEVDIITEDVLADPLCYNLSKGGHGGHTGAYRRGYKLPPEFGERQRQLKTGRPRPDIAIRCAMQQADPNYIHPWKGKKRTAEKSIARKRLIDDKKDVYFTSSGTCPHCGKTGQLANMKRWHYENCRFKKCD